MIVTEESVVIDRPIDEVFTFFADPAIVTLFMTNIITYEVVSGTAGEVGSVVQGVVKVAGRRLELTEELTGVEHGKYLRRRSIQSPIPYESETRFDPTESGTRVTWRQESDLPTGFFGRLADSIAAKLYARDVRSNLEHAKVLLESGVTS